MTTTKPEQNLDYKLELPYWINVETEPKRVKKTFGDSLPDLIGGNILDWGCSEGFTTEEIQKHYPNSRVVGIDINPIMIREARKNRRLGKFVVGDGYNLRYLDRIFDLVFCMNNIGFALKGRGYEKKDDVLSRVSRLVKSNGRLLISAGVDYVILKNNSDGFELESTSHDCEFSLYSLCTTLTGKSIAELMQERDLTFFRGSR